MSIGRRTFLKGLVALFSAPILSKVLPPSAPTRVVVATKPVDPDRGVVMLYRKKPRSTGGSTYAAQRVCLNESPFEDVIVEHRLEYPGIKLPTA